MKTISEVNALSEDNFVRSYADIAELSPWVARGAVYKRPFTSREAMVAAFEQALAAASEPAQLTLIRLHPDLAGKAKLRGDSAREQKGAGLDTLTGDEFQRFTSLNAQYKQKFGFPFIFAVKGATKHQILQSFEERIHNDKATEFAIALAQVKRIFRFRIEDRVSA